MMNQPQDATSVVMNFSDDEFALILDKMGVSRVASFVIPEGMNRDHAAAAQRSLLARDALVLQGDGTTRIAEGLEVLVRMMLEPQRVLTVTVSNPQIRGDHTFYMLPGIMIYHASPQPGVQTIQTLTQSLQFGTVITVLLGLDLESDEKPTDSTMTIDKKIYDSVRSLARSGQIQQAYERLESTNLPMSLRKSLVEPSAYGILSLANVNDGDVTEAGILLVLKAMEGYWLVRPAGQGMQTEPTTSDGVIDAVAKLMS